MRIRWALGWMSIVACLALASCSRAPQAVIRNASGADLLLWPLAARPVALRSGETTEPILYATHERQQALIERGNCLYTYPAPDYFNLPKHLRGYAPRVTVVIREDMSLSIHERSREGVEGAEIVAGGFPLRPTTYCGRRTDG